MAEIYGRLTGRAGCLLGHAGPRRDQPAARHRRRHHQLHPAGGALGPGGHWTAATRSPTRASTWSRCSPRSRSGPRSSPAPGRCRRWCARRSSSRRPSAPAPSTSPCPRTSRRPRSTGAAGPLPVNVPRPEEPSPSQVERAAEILREARSPIVLAGHGAARAGAGAALRALRRAAGRPRGDHLPRQGRLPRRPPARPRRRRLHAPRLRQLRLRRGRRRSSPSATSCRSSTRSGSTRAATRRSCTCTASPPRWTPTTTSRSGCTPTSAAASTRWPTPSASVATPPRRRRAHPGLLAERARRAAGPTTAFPLAPARVVADTRAALDRDDIVLVDTGALKMWMARLYPTYEPNTCLISNGLSTMALDAARRDRGQARPPGRAGCWSATGDGAFLMNSQEIETALRDADPDGDPDLGRRRLRADQLEDGSGDRPQRRHPLRQPRLRRLRRELRGTGYRIARRRRTAADAAHRAWPTTPSRSSPARSTTAPTWTSSARWATSTRPSS